MAPLPSVPTIKLGSQGLHVSAQGLGCMGMTPGFYSAPNPEEDMIDLLRYAESCGITYFDTGDLYGPFTNEILVGKAIKGIREKVQIGTKVGAYFDSGGGFGVRGDPEYVRESCEGSLKRLDTDYIDLYFYNRADPRVPIEVTIREMKKLVEEGKVKYLGLSEMSASTIRRAHAVYPVTAIQLEWSLWSREVEEEIIPTCRELGIGIVAYSPLGHGFLSVGAKLLEDLSDQDFRKAGLPRLQGENLVKNKVLYENLQRLASRNGCTPGQLALAWVQQQGSDVMPIPGTTKVKNLEENVGALAVKVSKEDMEEMEALFPPDVAAGLRSAPHALQLSDQDTPPLSSWQKA